MKEEQNDTDGIVTVSQLAQKLDISEATVSAFLPQHHEGSGWILDGNTIITQYVMFNFARYHVQLPQSSRWFFQLDIAAESVAV